MSGDEPPLTLEGWAVPEGLDDLHDLVERARASHPDVGENAFMMMETAVIEIANNVIEHGGPAGRVWWTFTLKVLPGMLEGELADDGQEYANDLSTVMPDPLAESGRGLALARAALDELAYARCDGKNLWTMRRRTVA